MKESFISWWSSLEAHEKSALVLLGVIVSVVFIFASGITIGTILF